MATGRNPKWTVRDLTEGLLETRDAKVRTRQRKVLREIRSDFPATQVVIKVTEI